MFKQGFRVNQLIQYKQLRLQITGPAGLAIFNRHLCMCLKNIVLEDFATTTICLGVSTAIKNCGTPGGLAICNRHFINSSKTLF